MSRAVVPIIAVAVVAVAGAGVLLATRAPAPTPVATAGAPAAPASPAAVRPRLGRVFSVSDAVKELDLVRPTRQKRAEDFDVPMARQQGTFRLGEHRGKPVMINFWATWCPPCLEEMPALERLYRRHREAGFVLIAVSLDIDPAKVSQFLTEHRLTFPVGLDPKTRVAELYGVRALPSTFLVDREGNLAALALGPRAWDNDAAHSLVEGLIK